LDLGAATSERLSVAMEASLALMVYSSGTVVDLAITSDSIPSLHWPAADLQPVLLFGWAGCGCGAPRVSARSQIFCQLCVAHGNQNPGIVEAAVASPRQAPARINRGTVRSRVDGTTHG
jgi:hypothetical protein